MPPERIKMPGLPPGGDMPMEPEPPELDPEFEDAALEAFPEMAADPLRLSALQRLIRAASKPAGLLIGIGKEKPAR